MSNTFNEKYKLWIPDMEGNPEKLIRHMIRRVTDVDVALEHVRTKGIAVQAGGFIGMWPRRLAKSFEYVFTFEPSPEHFSCLVMNTLHSPGVIATAGLLGPSSGSGSFRLKRGGCTTAVNGGDNHAAQYSIDELDLERCDAIYLDVERYELEVLKGAEETLRRHKPVVTLEVKEDTEQSWDNFMRDRGYVRARKVHGDVIYVPISK